MFLRAFIVQASWNYRTLIGHGFAFALLPALRAIYRGDPDRLQDAVRRHTQLFNGHPYLVPMALGAIATLEAEGEDPSLIERFKTAVRGSLGAIGDRLVWAGWRPVCLLLALALLFAGAPWWLAVAAFLATYNAGHLLLRSWSHRLGLSEGRRVGEHMRRSRIGSALRILPLVGAFLVGLILPLAVAGRGLKAIDVSTAASLPAPWIAASAVAAIVGARLGASIRTPVILALLGFSVLGILLRFLS